jgi:Tol biopolymer transport system component
MGADGSSRRILVGGRELAVDPQGLAWSPNGEQIAFAASKISPASNSSKQSADPSWIYLVGAEGGEPAPIPATRGGQEPVFSPDGSEIAFSRYKEKFDFDPKDPLSFHSYQSVTTWIVDLAGGMARRLTPWKNGYFAEPSSFSPDGSVLALDRNRGKGPEAVAYHLDSGQTSVIERGAEDPSFSPDGRHIALADYRDGIVVGSGEDRAAVGELYLVRTDGSHPTRLTHSREWQESAPSWDPSGRRITFIRSTAQFAIGLTNVVMEINADGTCPRRVLGRPRREGRYGPSLDGPGLYAPTWQPGPGREAGPIAC